MKNTHSAYKKEEGRREERGRWKEEGGSRREQRGDRRGQHTAGNI